MGEGPPKKVGLNFNVDDFRGRSDAKADVLQARCFLTMASFACSFRIMPSGKVGSTASIADFLPQFLSPRRSPAQCSIEDFSAVHCGYHRTVGPTQHRFIAEVPVKLIAFLLRLA